MLHVTLLYFPGTHVLPPSLSRDSLGGKPWSHDMMTAAGREQAQFTVA